MTAFQRQEDFARELDRFREIQSFPRGNNEARYATCPHCDSLTELIEHSPTAQLTLDPAHQRDQAYFTCEWCNREIPGPEAQPVRKAVESDWEDDIERVRRRAWSRRVA